MSSTPPPDDSEPPLLEEPYSTFSDPFNGHPRSAPASPTSSTGAEPDTDLAENITTWPNDSVEWGNRVDIGEQSTSATEHEWDSFRSENTMMSESSGLGIADTVESDLLDIDE